MMEINRFNKYYPNREKLQAFLIPDTEVILSYGDVIELVDPDNNPASGPLLVDTTFVLGRPGNSGFIKYLNVVSLNTNEKLKISVGALVRHIGVLQKMEVIE